MSMLSLLWRNENAELHLNSGPGRNQSEGIRRASEDSEAARPYRAANLSADTRSRYRTMKARMIMKEMQP